MTFYISSKSDCSTIYPLCFNLASEKSSLFANKIGAIKQENTLAIINTVTSFSFNNPVSFDICSIAIATIIVDVVTNSDENTVPFF